jgi:hypothetical protein
MENTSRHPREGKVNRLKRVSLNAVDRKSPLPNFSNCLPLIVRVLSRYQRLVGEATEGRETPLNFPPQVQLRRDLLECPDVVNHPAAIAGVQESDS